MKVVSTTLFWISASQRWNLGFKIFCFLLFLLLELNSYLFPQSQEILLPFHNSQSPAQRPFQMLYFSEILCIRIFYYSLGKKRSTLLGFMLFPIGGHFGDMSQETVLNVNIYVGGKWRTVLDLYRFPSTSQEKPQEPWDFFSSNRRWNTVKQFTANISICYLHL